MLKAYTRGDYRDIRQQILKKLNLNDNDLPSYYYITLQQPKMVSGTIDIKEKYKVLSRKSKINLDNNKKVSKFKKKKIQVKYFTQLKDISFSSILQHMLTKCECKFNNENF